MANPNYKFTIDAPATVNKVKSIEFIPDITKGRSFRIAEGSSISVPDLDAIATGDTMQFQISTQSQSEASALYEISSEYEVYTFAREFGAFTTEGNQVIQEDPQKKLIMDGIDGIHLESGKKYYMNQLVTGQDGVLPMELNLRGSYTKKDVEDFHNKSFGG